MPTDRKTQTKITETSKQYIKIFPDGVNVYNPINSIT